MERKVVTIRTGTGAYAAVLFVAAFFSGLLAYFSFDIAALFVLIAAVAILPPLAFLDHISFDGRRLTRTGVIPKWWSRLNQTRYRIRVSDVEVVETYLTQTIRRSGGVAYNFRTVVRGKGAGFTFNSAGKGFRPIVKAILSKLPDELLDARSRDLRDHYDDLLVVSQRAERLSIPSADVLENSLESLLDGQRTLPPRSDIDENKVSQLVAVGNQLRVGGSLLRAVEAIRRALILKPGDATLLFEFGRCLYTAAAVRKDARVKRKAEALLRLAATKAAGEHQLLERIGDHYFQIGNSSAAERLFKRAAEIGGESFRILRSQADVALSDGKLAHVIQKLSAAIDHARSPALRRWARAEFEYFSRLIEDEEYMELEISRMNLIDSLSNVRRTSLHIAMVAFPMIAIGMYSTENVLADIGWAVAGIALVLWLGLLCGCRLISSRIPHDLLDDE